MKSNRTLAALVVAFILAGSAHATGLNLGGTTNEGGTGIGVGVGIAAQHQNATAIGVNTNRNDSNASAANSVTITNTESQRPVSSAIAAGLAAANGTCMGSSSVGAQGLTAGLSFGTTWTDGGCDARYDAQALQAAGMPDAAVARLCQKAEIAAAMEKAGRTCPGAKAKTASAPAAAPTMAEYTDPLIRRRLGLPPL